MNNYIKARITYVFCSAISLFAGVMIYIIFREGTYIHQIIPQNFIGWTEQIRETTQNCFFVSFLKYYFVDFLWAFSLDLLLMCVTDFKKISRTIFLSAVSGLWGICFEFAQLFSIVNGYFDFVDILMYIFAVILAALINIILVKRMYFK